MKKNRNSRPLLFKKYPGLKNKVPWIPILTNTPTPVDRLTKLEDHLNTHQGRIYIKRDDKDHHIYGGNKLRKFEFIFGDILEKENKGVMTFGGIGTNHGLACAIVAKELGIKCHLFLAYQPLTWHVQRSLLLYNYFGAKLHYAKRYGVLALKALLYRLFHPGLYVMLPGGSLLLGMGNPLGTVGFINALIELHEQIQAGSLVKPNAIFVAGGSTGTAAGLIAGIKLLNLDIKVYVVGVSDDMFVNTKSIMVNSNKTLEYLQELDNSIPKVKVEPEDFEVVSGYLGSEYGVKTVRGQHAVDLVMELEGEEKGFQLETTYTGKAMAGMLDFLQEEKNQKKTVLFWNTYNSNDLDEYIKETDFNWKTLPKKFHQFFKNKHFQCWQINDCPIDKREECDAYLNHEYRCWLVKNCPDSDKKDCKAFTELNSLIELEEA